MTSKKMNDQSLFEIVYERKSQTSKCQITFCYTKFGQNGRQHDEAECGTIWCAIFMATFIPNFIEYVRFESDRSLLESILKKKL